MDRGLAKQLKSAGFPQPIAENQGGYYDYGDYFDEEPVYVPTLSELIEACGDLDLEFTGNPTIGYEATSLKTFRFQSITGKGKTAEEAFARLWLALHNSR